MQDKYWINKSWLAKPWLSAEAIIGFLLMLSLSLPYVAVFSAITEIDVGSAVLSDLVSTRVLSLIRSSLLLSTLVAIVSTCVGLIVALCTIFSKSKALSRSLLIGGSITFCISPVVLLSAWQSIPWVTGITPLTSVVAVLSWSYFPIPLLILWLTINNLESSGLEYGRLIGEPYQILRFIVLPQLKLPLLISACIVFLFTFMQSEVPSLLNYPGYAEEFLARVILEDTLGPAVLLALPMIMMMLLVLPILVWQGRSLLNSSWRTGGMKVIRELLHSERLFIILSLLILLIIILPIAILFWRGEFHDFVAFNGTTILSSLVLAIPSSLIAVFLAHLIVEGIVVFGTIGRTAFLGVILVQILLPGALFGLGMISLSQWPGMAWIKTGDLLLITTHAMRILPFIVLLLLGLRLQRSSEKIQEYALLGIGWYRRQLHIRLPEEKSGLFIAGALSFALVLSELSTTVLVIAPGTETTILRLYNLIHYGDWATVSALALVQALMVTVILLTISLLGLRSSDKN